MATKVGLQGSAVDVPGGGSSTIEGVKVQSKVVSHQGMEGVQLANWCKALEPSVLREMIDVVSKEPGIINLATGLPERDFFPIQEYKEGLAQALANDPLTLQYRPPFEPLKNHIVEIMKKRLVTCKKYQKNNFN